MQFYFAYGSNLDFDDWSLWCSKKNANPEGLVEYRRAFLPGFTVKYSHYSSGREGGAANLYPVANNLVGTYGALFEIDKNWKHPKNNKKITQLLNNLPTTSLRSIKIL